MLAPYAAKARVTQEMHRPGCTDQPNFEFLAMMIPHLECAVDMAQLVWVASLKRPAGADAAFFEGVVGFGNGAPAVMLNFRQ